MGPVSSAHLACQFLNHGKLLGWCHSHRGQPLHPTPDLFSQLQQFGLVKEVPLPCNTLTFTSAGREAYPNRDRPLLSPSRGFGHRSQAATGDCQHHSAHPSLAKASEFLSFTFCVPQPPSPALNKPSSLHLVICLFLKDLIPAQNKLSVLPPMAEFAVWNKKAQRNKTGLCVNGNRPNFSFQALYH